MKPIDRVAIIIHKEGLSISAFEKLTGMSNNSIQTALKRKSNLKDDTLNNILNAFPDVSAEWLLTGRGEMHNLGSKMGPNMGPKSNTNTKDNTITNKMVSKMVSNTVPNFQETDVSIQENREGNRFYLEDVLIERDRVIEALNEIINTQKDLIKSQKSLIDLFRQRIEGDEDQTKNTG